MNRLPARVGTKLAGFGAGFGSANVRLAKVIGPCRSDHGGVTVNLDQLATFVRLSEAKLYANGHFLHVTQPLVVCALPTVEGIVRSVQGGDDFE